MRICLAIAGCILLQIAAGCSKQATKTDDLRSEIENAAFLSRECELLLDLRSAGKVTDDFRKVHEHYLSKQIEELEKNLQKSPPEPTIQPVFEEYKTKLQQLNDALDNIEAHPQKERFIGLTQELEALEQRL